MFQKVASTVMQARPLNPCPSCGRQPASRAEIHDHRAEMAILWLHLDGGRITEAHHCATCQPHDHVVDVACADCGDGPLITGQPPTSATTPPTWR